MMLSTAGKVMAWFDVNPKGTVRECSASLNLTERTVFSAIEELQGREYLSLRKSGRKTVKELTREGRKLAVAARVLYAA